MKPIVVSHTARLLGLCACLSAFGALLAPVQAQLSPVTNQGPRATVQQRNIFQRELVADVRMVKREWGSTQVAITVRNIGTMPTGPFFTWVGTWRRVWGPDGYVRRSDEWSIPMELGPADPNSTNDETTYYVWIPSAPSGESFRGIVTESGISIEADFQEVVPELIESNNGDFYWEIW